MNFALLGIDDDVLRLARELTAHGEHEIVSIFEAGEHEAAARALSPSVSTAQEWESLLLESVVDGVIVGRAGAPLDTRADQLRKLVQANVPLVVVHPTTEYIVGYEIEMIRRDVGSVVIPYYPGIATAPVAEILAAGTTEPLALERRQHDRTRAAVLSQLARDAEIARRLLGAVTKVGAVGSLSTERASTLTVQLANEAGRSLRWSIEPVVAAPGAVVQVTREEDQVSFPLMDTPQDTRIFCQRLPALLTGAKEPEVTWMDCCRAQEIADTVPRCLARGRTIDLYNEEHTEEGAFKGVMAVGGCLILLLGLLGVVFVAVLEGLQLPLYRFAVWSHWPLYLCAAFFFFLALQLLRLAARR